MPVNAQNNRGFSVKNIKRMTPAARTLTRKNLRVSKLSNLSSKKIITMLILLSLPTGTNAFAFVIPPAVIAACVSFATGLMAALPQMMVPAAYAGSAAVMRSQVIQFLSNTNVRVYSAIIAAITVILLLQRIYSSQTTRLQIAANKNKHAAQLVHNDKQKQLNRDAANRAGQRQLEMLNRMIQGQGTMVQSAIQSALTMTQPMLLQLQQGQDPVVPIPRVTRVPPMVLGSGRRQRTNNVNHLN